MIKCASQIINSDQVNKFVKAGEMINRHNKNCKYITCGNKKLLQLHGIETIMHDTIQNAYNECLVSVYNYLDDDCIPMEIC